MGEHVVADDEVRTNTTAREVRGALLAEEADLRRDPCLDRGLGDVRSGFDTEHRDAARDKVLEQVAVVARDLDDEAVGPEVESVDRLVCVTACVFDPGIGIRREVGVVGEDLLGWHHVVDLYEQTLVTHSDMEWVDRFGTGGQLLLGQVRVGEGLETEIQNGAMQWRSAGPTRRRGAAHQTFQGAVSVCHISSSSSFSQSVSIGCQNPSWA